MKYQIFLNSGDVFFCYERTHRSFFGANNIIIRFYLQLLANRWFEMPFIIIELRPNIF